MPDQPSSPHLLLISTDFKVGGGGHQCLLRHVQRFTAQKVRTSLLTLELPATMPESNIAEQAGFSTVHEIPRCRWYWPRVVHRLPWTMALRRLIVQMEAFLTILRLRPDGILMSFNGSCMGWCLRMARRFNIPTGMIVYDLREIWADTPYELAWMEADARRALGASAHLWFVTEELRAEYQRRVPGLDLGATTVLPPIPGGRFVPAPAWRPEFAGGGAITFAGALKSSNHDVFKALMNGMRRRGGSLRIITQASRLPALKEQLAEYKDVLELKPIFTDLAIGLPWIANHSICVLVHYSFEDNSEILSRTSFPSKLLEYSFLGLPILIAAPMDTPVAQWAEKVDWPLRLDSLEPAKVEAALEQLKDEAFWNRCAQRTLEAARNEFNPDRIHETLSQKMFTLLGGSPAGR